jgi:hypothetical protein
MGDQGYWMNRMAKSGTMKANHRSLFPKRNKREGNQANHERQHQGILHPVRIAPTTIHSKLDLVVNDYRRK